MKTLFLIFLAVVVAVAVVNWEQWRDWIKKDPGPGLTRKFGKSLVFVEGKSGVGSGFVCEIAGKKFVLTNQHVVAGNPGVTFTLLDRSPIKTGQAAVAVGHDVMSFAVLSDTEALEMMTDVMQEAATGDEVAVLGNSNGDRVIKPLVGKLVAIGPDRLEVFADLQPGNSGSPIIHIKSGKVIGVATYASTRRVNEITGNRLPEPEVKYFGYRLDSVKQWQPVNWAEYTAEYQALEKIKTRTTEILKMLLPNHLNPVEYDDPAIRAALMRYLNAGKGGGLIKTDKVTAARDALASLRNACDTDTAQVQGRVQYDYFRKQLDEQQKIRTAFYQLLDQILKRTAR